MHESRSKPRNVILEVDDLSVVFPSNSGPVTAVRGVSFHVEERETVAIVGESGSGKTVTGKAIMQLLGRHSGMVQAKSIRLGSSDLLRLSERELRRVRGGEIAMIFQDPMTALNPVLTVGSQLAETARTHDRSLSRQAARKRALDVLAAVEFPSPESAYGQYPHTLSGGMRQRVMIALAIIGDPKLLIADEPTTALDVTIQAQILNLLGDLTESLDLALILITHDLGVVAEIADRVLVMYAGQIVEQGTVDGVFSVPKHPYTVGLSASRPRLDVRSPELAHIAGHPPDPTQLGNGCSFEPRCNLSAGRSRCRMELPKLTPKDDAMAGHLAACHFSNEIATEIDRLISATGHDFTRGRTP